MAEKANAVLITGGSSGIGRELARLFAADGVPLVLVARGAAELARTAAELTRTHQVEVTTIAADLSVPAEIERLVERIRAGGVEVEVLVNNAGFGGGGPFVRSRLADDLGMIAVNRAAVTHRTRLLLPATLERGQRAFSARSALSIAARAFPSSSTSADGSSERMSISKTPSIGIEFTDVPPFTTLTLNVVGDTLPEGTETLTILLSVPGNGTILDGIATITITDDDSGVVQQAATPVPASASCGWRSRRPSRAPC
jgi:hypothetical protein